MERIIKNVKYENKSGWIQTIRFVVFKSDDDETVTAKAKQEILKVNNDWDIKNY